MGSQVWSETIKSTNVLGVHLGPIWQDMEAFRQMAWAVVQKVSGEVQGRFANWGDLSLAEPIEEIQEKTFRADAESLTAAPRSRKRPTSQRTPWAIAHPLGRA
jgi:hypothetical protein